MSGAGYDPKIIERFAEQLLRKADTVRVGFAVGGGIFGVVVGSVPLTPLKSIWGVPAGFGLATIIVGALLGILLGYVIGEGRAFHYRVQAQNAIFQLEIERRVTSAVAEAVANSLPARAQAETPAPLAPAALTETAEPPAAAESEELPPVAPLPRPSDEGPPLSEPRLRPPGASGPTASATPGELPAPPLSPAVNG
ncbi:MAG TPA: hypothetical protein VF002_05575 [Gaiellaceae bacterium]